MLRLERLFLHHKCMVSDTRAKTWRLDEAKQPNLSDVSEFRALNSDASTGRLLLENRCMVAGARAKTRRQGDTK